MIWRRARRKSREKKSEALLQGKKIVLKRHFHGKNKPIFRFFLRPPQIINGRPLTIIFYFQLHIHTFNLIHQLSLVVNMTTKTLVEMFTLNWI